MLTRIDHVLNADELATIANVYARVPAVSGKSTASGLAREVKVNLQLPTEDTAVKDISRLVLKALKRNGEFYHTAFPRRAFPPLFSRYEPGMHYGEHVDNSVMAAPTPLRTDVAVTLFLSDPASYDGGELVIRDGPNETAIKLPAGSLIAYPPHFLHYVAPVTRGRRDAAITWIESLVRDLERRRVLMNIDRALTDLYARFGDQPELHRLNNCYHTLMRMWAET
jgi:PKHD-type hydroxylase